MTFFLRGVSDGSGLASVVVSLLTVIFHAKVGSLASKELLALSVETVTTETLGTCLMGDAGLVSEGSMSSLSLPESLLSDSGLILILVVWLLLMLLLLLLPPGSASMSC